MAIIDFTSAEDAAAFALAVTSSGSLRSYKTVSLPTVAQSIESMKRAAKLRKKYAPPTTVSLVEQKTPART